MNKLLAWVPIALLSLTIAACNQQEGSNSTTLNESTAGGIVAASSQETKYSFLPGGDSTTHTIHYSDFAKYWSPKSTKNIILLHISSSSTCNAFDMPSAICVDSPISIEIGNSESDKIVSKIDLPVLGRMNRNDLKGYVLDTAVVLHIDEKRKEYLIEVVSMLPATDAPRIYTWFFVDFNGKPRLLDSESDFTGASMILDIPGIIVTHSGIFKKDGNSVVYFKDIFEVSESLPIVSLERVGKNHLIITNQRFLYLVDLHGKIIAKEEYSGVEQEFFLTDRISYPDSNHVYACDCNNFRVFTISADTFGTHIRVDSLSKLPRMIQKTTAPLLFECLTTEQNPGAIALYRDAAGRPVSYVLAKVDYGKR